VDPLAIESLEPLSLLLADPQVLKVLHACSEDLEVFQYSVGTLPTPVFDSQIASAALGTSFSISYQGLVEHYLGHSISKEETRSDWLQRPLSDAQLEYAALDVIYLLEVYENQRVQLLDQDKLRWIEEECAQLAGDIATNVAPEAYYLRSKHTNRMSPGELNVFRALCAWRERQARQKDLPRNRVVDEKILAALSRGGIAEPAALQAAGMSSRQIRQHGQAMIEVMITAWSLAESDFPAPLEEVAGPAKNRQLKRLKQVVQDRAESLNVAPEMLARRRHLEQLLRSASASDDYELPAALTGWRRHAIGEHLLAALKRDQVNDRSV
ncbi:MAG: ribonuclease D, partial [Pseudohongiellaceae bacterium]